MNNRSTCLLRSGVLHNQLLCSRNATKITQRNKALWDSNLGDDLTRWRTTRSWSRYWKTEETRSHKESETNRMKLAISASPLKAGTNTWPSSTRRRTMKILLASKQGDLLPSKQWPNAEGVRRAE